MISITFWSKHRNKQYRTTKITNTICVNICKNCYDAFCFGLKYNLDFVD